MRTLEEEEESSKGIQESEETTTEIELELSDDEQTGRPFQNIWK